MKKWAIKTSIWVVACFLAFAWDSMAIRPRCEVKVQKIWDNGNHCAFTSLVKFKGKYYCSFREGESHIFDKQGKAEGKVRIIVSKDGKKWTSAALLSKPSFDLRDPKLSVTPDNRLMVIIGGSVYENKKLTARQPQVTFSSDGHTFSELEPIRIDSRAKNGIDWLWRVTWDDQFGYGVVYSMIAERDGVINLVRTTDGINYEWVSKLDVSGFPNESTVRLLPDKQMQIMVRRELESTKGFWGVSKPPYTEWNWKEMEFRLGGPDFIHLNDSLIVMGSRSHYTSFTKTVLLTGKGNGKFQEVYVLPSGGDNSYPGFLIEGNQLWVSFYSSHETPLASVYLAQFPLAFFTR